tara:strand:+ start:74 stop:292 length:219 start_codon:yes stop_codon:yes gene_type:complete
MRKFTKKEEKKLLCRYIEVLCMNGYDISNVIQKPCSYFCYESIIKGIVRIQTESGQWENEQVEEFLNDPIYN